MQRKENSVFTFKKLTRKARFSDVMAIYKLIEFYSKSGEMLPRSYLNIYQNLRDFTVYEKNGRVIGVGALHFVWDKIGEIRSLAVSKKYQGIGVGSTIVRCLLEEASEFGIKSVFTLTFKPAFFKNLGFKPIKKKTLPNKIWADCLNCPQFPECNEEALVIKISAFSKAQSKTQGSGKE